MFRLLLWKGDGFNGSLLRRALATAVQTQVKSNGPVQQLTKDVILYKNENVRFYRFLNLFALSQLGFWSFMAYNTLSLKDVPVDPEVEKNADLPFWRKINLGDETLRKVMGIGYAFIGYAILAGSWMYTLRSIRYVILRKDRVSVSLVLFSPFGPNRIMDVPLRSISAVGSRMDRRSYIPLKVEDRKFYYLLESNGTFPNAALFDQTVGVKRKFKPK